MMVMENSLRRVAVKPKSEYGINVTIYTLYSTSGGFGGTQNATC